MKRLFALIILVYLTNNIFAQSFQKDPYTKTFITNTHYQSDQSIQKQLRDRAVWQNFTTAHGNWWVEFDQLTGMPLRATGKPITTTGTTPQERAEQFINTNLTGFNIPADELLFRSANTSAKYSYIDYTQTYMGLDVLFTDVKVQMTLDGSVVLFNFKAYPSISANISPAISADAIKTFADADFTINITSTSVAPQLKLLPIATENGMQYHLVYEVNVWTKDAENIPGNYYSLVDAHNGEVLYRENRVEACGKYMMDGADLLVNDDVSVNPLLDVTNERLPYIKVVVDGDTYYTNSSGDLSIPSVVGPTNAHVYLDGLYAKVYQDNGSDNPDFTTTITVGSNTITFPESTNLSAISAYYNQNKVHDYMKLNWPAYTGSDFNQRINTEIDGSCNAYYDGNSTNFFPESATCPNTALFDDVVMHEYGHSLNYNLYDWLGGTMDNGAMQEAYADIWAISVTHNPVLGQGFFGGAGTFVRKYDGSPKVYPADLVGEPHADGEIIAGAWWDLAENLGDDVNAMDDIWHETHYATIDGADGDEGNIYRNVLLQALLADDDDADISNGTPNWHEILDAFAEHGIYLLPLIQVIHEELPASQPALTDITINATLDIDFPLDVATIDLFYKKTSDATWASMPMTTVLDNYTASIPGQPDGTILEYYFELSDLYAQSFTTPPHVTDAQPNLPYFLLVGRDQILIEDFDNTFGDWVVNPTGIDDATSGIWQVGSPNQTISGSYIVQPGIDHTEGETNLCAYTGSSSPGAAIGTNDVDKGQTTIQSPPFDLTDITDPIFSYYRWYTNDSGANPGNDNIVVKISNNGADWITVENTKASDNRWRRNVLRVSDYVEPTATVYLQFTASDNIIAGADLDGGSVVEEAADDISIWGLVNVDTANSVMNPTSIVGIYPNPANDILTIRFENIDSKMQVELFNALGKLVYSGNVTGSGNRYLNVYTATLAEGIYTVHCSNNAGAQNKKIIILH